VQSAAAAEVYAHQEGIVNVSADGTPTARLHIAFQADRETVERFHEAGLAAGGRDNGASGERPYYPGYYGAYLLYPDGNNVEPSTTIR
jgi:hypothetical protein